MEALEKLQIDYAIYPSLLDAFLRFKKYDDDETFINLLSKINKVKTEQTEQQLRGVAFEKCVNNTIDNLNAKRCLWDGVVNGMYIINGFEFTVELVDKIALKLQYAVKKQEYMEVIFPSHLGNIKLYGITDYCFPGMITDLKTTDSYKCNKYKDNTQHPTYSLISKLKGNPIDSFKYVVTDFKRDFQETYIPNLSMERKLLNTTFEFIHFLNHFDKRGKITDRKVFGG